MIQTHRSTIQSPPSSNLFASQMLAFLSTSMLNTKPGRRLRGLVAPGYLAPLSTAVSRAEIGPTHGRFVATVILAAFASTMTVPFRHDGKNDKMCELESQHANMQRIHVKKDVKLTPRRNTCHGRPCRIPEKCTACLHHEQYKIGLR